MKYNLVFLLCWILGFASAQTEECAIVYYPFDGNALDVSGNENNGIAHGDIQLTSDRFGNPDSAYEFDGIDDFIESSSDDFNLGLSDFTVSFWYKQYSYGNYQFFGKERWGDTSMRYGAQIFGNAQVSSNSNRFYYRDAFGSNGEMWSYQTGQQFISSFVSELGEWYHIVIVRSDLEYSMYVNGVLETTIHKDNKHDLVNEYNFRIGARYLNNGTNDSSDHFHGAMDEFRMYDCGLSAKRILELYDNTERSTTLVNQLKDEDIQIFPNPNDGRFSIRNQSDNHLKNLVLYNSIGEQIIRFDLNANETKEINLNDIPSGIYLVQIDDITKRVVIVQPKA